MANARWRRLTEERAGGAKSVFHFDVQGSVAKSTHSADSVVPIHPPAAWGARAFLALRRLGHSGGTFLVAEVYPALWSRSFARTDQTSEHLRLALSCRP